MCTLNKYSYMLLQVNDFNIFRFNPPMIEHIIQLQCNMSFFKIEAIHDIHQMLCTFCKKNVKEL